MQLLFPSIVVTVFMLGSAAALAATPTRAAPRELVDEGENADPKALTDAVALYEAHKPQAASLALHDLLADGSYPAFEGKIRYFYALSLADLGLERSGQHQLVEVVRRGKSDPYFALALGRMVAFAERTGDDGDLLRIAGKLSAEDTPASVRDAFAWLRGVKSYEAGDLSAARESLAQVSERSVWHSRAQYLTGVILEQQERPRSAVEAFREVVQAPVAAPTAAARDANERARDLSVLNVARVHYEVGNWEEAQGWYDAVPRRSAYWPEAQYEGAWASLQAKDVNTTLGRLLTLKAPSFAADEFMPEAPVVEAITWYQLCQHDRVDAVLADFDAHYRPMHTELQAFVRSYATPEGRELAADAWNRYFGPDAAPTVLPKSLFNRILRDGELAATVAQLDAIEAEEHTIQAQKASWRDVVGDSLTADLAAERERLERRAGLNMLGQMATMSGWLGDLLDQSQIIQFENVDGRRKVYDDLTTSLVATRPVADVPFAVSTDKIYWPFNGEFWDDELGSYQYAETSLCQ